LIGQLAASDATALITGESGTGKELVARAIYHHSKRSEQPFLAINCAAIPENLLESELFGHERGAFTGALTQRIGKFEQCDRGTIFLDEIGDMSLATQTRMLRVLQSGTFERVGGNHSVKVDVRVIAATNKILTQEVEDNRFREDLYYRLNVISIYLPPLRDRRDDIPLLVEHFLHKHRYLPSSQPSRVSQGAMQLMMDYHWPGNVRELENIIERASVLAQGGIITEDHISFTGADNRRFIDVGQRIRKGTRLGELMQDVERLALCEALAQTDGDRIAASSLLGLDVTELRERLETYGL
jgi:DNA-binding NtrC family response regulator